MALDIASLLLGDFSYTLRVAFGGIAGWIIGHLIVVAIVSVIILAARDRVALREQLGLSQKRLGLLAALSLIFIAQHIIYSTTLGFPFVGAFVTALAATLFIGWSLETVAPASG